MIKKLIGQLIKELEATPKNINDKLKRAGVKRNSLINRLNQIELIKKFDKIRLTNNKKRVLQLICNDYPSPEQLSKKTKIRLSYVKAYLKEFKGFNLVRPKKEDSKLYELTYEGKKYLRYSQAPKKRDYNPYDYYKKKKVLTRCKKNSVL